METKDTTEKTKTEDTQNSVKSEGQDDNSTDADKSSTDQNEKDDVLLSDTESVTESTLIDNIENKIKEVSLNTDKNNKKGDDKDQDGNVTYDEAEISKAEDFKNKGNVYYQECKLEQAMEMYTEAIFCKVPAQKKSVYYCNRALVHIKAENNSFALFDACESIKLNKDYVKAYYRRGQAYVALKQFENAVLDFKTVCKLQPDNTEAKAKLATTEKMQMLAKLQASSLYEEQKISINPASIKVEKEYSGPRLQDIDDITPEWVQELIKWQKNQKKLHKKYVTMIINKATELFEVEKNCVNIQIDELEHITVCGDVHGQYYDLCNIFHINGMPSEENPYLFNGDFVDRGSFSVEVIICLLAWKICLPQHFFMSRGNHEAKQLTKMYGFEGEMKNKYDLTTYNLCTQMFCFLPLCHTINKKIFVTHGGVFSKDDVTIADIQKINRKREPSDEGLMCEALWSDPCDSNGRMPSKRGIGVQFGPDVTEKFLKNNDLKLLVRSHEVKPEGYEYQAGGKCVTVFSAPNYCDQMGNKGAYIKFDGTSLEPNINSFEKVDHPNIPPMAYANMWNFF